MYLNSQVLLEDDGQHEASRRICKQVYLNLGRQQLYILGYAYARNSEIEITYSGPDTNGVRTVIGGKPFFYACDPSAPLLPVPLFTLCTFKSDPTSAWNGDCTPTVGIAHPRYPGPCAKAIGTVSRNFEVFAGGFFTPALGTANNDYVSSSL